MDAEQRILCLAARAQLDDNDAQRLLALLRGPVDWDRLWELAHLHDVVPLLAASLRSLQGQAPIPAGWLARAQRRLYATLLHNTALADELVRACRALRASGIGALAVKGVVLAETLYDSLGLRPTADLDVLVRPDDLPKARAALRELGFDQRGEAPAEQGHPFHDPRYYRTASAVEVCLELHWALWPAHRFRPPAESWWDRSVEIQVHGAQVHTLSPEDTLLHLAIHRTDEPLRLRFLCDIAELLRRHSARLDWDYLLAQARGAGARVALFSALAPAHAALGAPLPPDLLPQLGVGWLRRRLLERACGIAAMVHPHAQSRLFPWPYTPLRLLVLDDAGQAARELGYQIGRLDHVRLAGYRRGWRLGASK
jgi:putative nucleotidyltransferase-like protein